MNLKQEIQKRPTLRGRPSKYDDKYAEKAFSLFLDGYSQTKVCSALNISRDTFNRWKNDHEQFKAAAELGDVHSAAKFESLYEQVMLGNIKNAKANLVIQYARNRLKWDQPEVKTGGNTINIQNAAFMELSSEELDKRIDLLNKQVKQLDG